MNRRSILKAIVQAPVAAALPVPVVAPVLPVGKLTSEQLRYIWDGFITPAPTAEYRGVWFHTTLGFFRDDCALRNWLYD